MFTGVMSLKPSPVFFAALIIAASTALGGATEPAWAQAQGQPSQAGRADTTQKGALLYQADMARQESVEDWRMEGPGEIRFADGWMHMWSPDEKGHHVFWAPETFPSRFVAEWKMQNREPDAGLALVFFAAKGTGGKSIFDPSLPEREGVYERYHSGAIDAYHLSYYANAPHNPDREQSNLRKSKGFHLAATGPEGIPTESEQVHKMRLVKDGTHIRMYVDDRKIIDWTDEGEQGGPALAEGKIGLRQMKWTHFRYRDFKVWALASAAP